MALIDLFRLLLLVGIAVGAWFVSRRSSEVARVSARLFSITASLLLVVLAFTGWLRGDDAVAAIHKWTGHVTVIAVWLGVPVAIGVTMQRRIREQTLTAITQTLALLATLGVTVLCSVTGYLGPTHLAEQLDEERSRFLVLHVFVLPALLAMLLIGWFLYFPRRDP